MADCRKYFFIVMVLFAPAIAGAQTDSVAANNQDSVCKKIYKCKTIKRGFYKNKEEFLTNSPSITRNFAVEKLTTSDKKISAGIMVVRYKLANGEAPIQGRVWGFADSNIVYVYHPSGWGNFWQLDCVGPHPFFIYPLKKLDVPLLPFNKLSPSGLFPFVLDLANSASYEVFTMDKKGRFSRSYSEDMIELFESEPDIQYDFRHALGPDITEPNLQRGAITRKYLNLFNERSIQNE